MLKESEDDYDFFLRRLASYFHARFRHLTLFSRNSLFTYITGMMPASFDLEGGV